MDQAKKLGLRMTLDEFLLWDSGDNRRYELVAGEILLIDQGRAFVELLRRLDGHRWLTILAIGIDAKVMLESLDLELRLADLYRDVEIEADEDTAGDG